MHDGTLEAQDPSAYLGEDDAVQTRATAVVDKARELQSAAYDDIEFAASAFRFVRDEVQHSWDVQDPRVTVSASETLQERVGLCFAKSHLLAALLRCGGVPTGLCYQRLTDDGRTFEVHGLVAVHLEGGWHRQDPRGNKPGVDARFSLGEERLAWPVRTELGERDYPQVYVHPHPVVLSALRGATDILALCGGGLPSELDGHP